MNQIPKFFIDNVPAKMHLEVEKWWYNLGESMQSEIISFWKGSDNEQKVNETVKNVNEYLELQKADFDSGHKDLYELDFPRREFYEYLVNHEIYLDVFDKKFHICTAHQKIREYLLIGYIPKEFACPLKSENCIIRSILEKCGWSIRLKYKLKTRY